MFIINEDSRTELVTASKQGKKGRDNKNRYQRRVKSRVINTVKQFNKINMNKLFKDNIIDITIEVIGETDTYEVKISYGGFLDTLKNELKRYGSELIDLRLIIKALIIAFNKNDIYINCSCPDWRYRMGYWATVKKLNSGELELRPSNQTNPNNDLGPGCKHVILVLANTSWIIKVASVINNYIKYMIKYSQKQYANIIYPAIYGKKYVGEVQQNIFDDDLITDKETIDKSNKEGSVSGRFSSTNQPMKNLQTIKPKEREIVTVEEEE